MGPIGPPGPVEVISRVVSVPFNTTAGMVTATGACGAGEKLLSGGYSVDSNGILPIFAPGNIFAVLSNGPTSGGQWQVTAYNGNVFASTARLVVTVLCAPTS